MHTTSVVLGCGSDQTWGALDCVSDYNSSNGVCCWSQELHITRGGGLGISGHKSSVVLCFRL